MTPTILVVWCVGNRSDYAAFDNRVDAEAKYAELLEMEDLYSANITVVVKSTDYWTPNEHL